MLMIKNNNDDKQKYVFKILKNVFNENRKKH